MYHVNQSTVYRMVNRAGVDHRTATLGQEVTIYGSAPSKNRDKYRLLEFNMFVPVGLSPEKIRDYLEELGIYQPFRQGQETGKSMDNRVTVAGETKRGRVRRDWKSYIKKKLDGAMEKTDRHRDYGRSEKKTVRANTSNKKQYKRKEGEFYDNY